MEHVLIGCGAGFSGDRVDAPIALVNDLAGRDGARFLILETLGERTLALAQKAKIADPNAGFEPLLEQLLRPILKSCLDSGIRIVSNFGAANPHGAARLVKGLAAELGCRQPRIALVLGDDLTGSLREMPLSRWDGEAEGTSVDYDRMVAANAYLGADGIVQGLDNGADIVVTGRVADPSLVLGPLRHVFEWDPQDWDRIASGILAGHLLECGSQVCGGYFCDPGVKDLPDMDNVGYPIARIGADGSIEIGKAAHTGGAVTAQTVKEQLLYEIHDPSCYITPDGVLDLTGVELQVLGPDRVAVRGARGKPATDTYKVTVSQHGGWLGEGELSYAGPNAEARARMAGDILLKRLDRRGLQVRARIDLIGVVSVFGDDKGILSAASVGDAQDVRVRLAVETRTRSEACAATQEVFALLCAGPAGGGGARERHVERIHTMSCLVPKSSIPVYVEML